MASGPLQPHTHARCVDERVATDKNPISPITQARPASGHYWAGVRNITPTVNQSVFPEIGTRATPVEVCLEKTHRPIVDEIIKRIYMYISLFHVNWWSWMWILIRKLKHFYSFFLCGNLSCPMIITWQRFSINVTKNIEIILLEPTPKMYNVYNWELLHVYFSKVNLKDYLLNQVNFKGATDVRLVVFGLQSIQSVFTWPRNNVLLYYNLTAKSASHQVSTFSSCATSQKSAAAITIQIPRATKFLWINHTNLPSILEIRHCEHFYKSHFKSSASSI